MPKCCRKGGRGGFNRGGFNRQRIVKKIRGRKSGQAIAGPIFTIQDRPTIDPGFWQSACR